MTIVEQNPRWIATGIKLSSVVSIATWGTSLLLGLLSTAIFVPFVTNTFGFNNSDALDIVTRILRLVTFGVWYVAARYVSVYYRAEVSPTQATKAAGLAAALWAIVAASITAYLHYADMVIVISSALFTAALFFMIAKRYLVHDGPGHRSFRVSI